MNASRGTLSPLFTWRSAIASETGPKDVELRVVRNGEPTISIVKGSTQRHVALTLSLHMNEKGSSCYPGVPLISQETSLGERAVQRALQALATTGWLAVERESSPLGTNIYTATIPGGVPSTPASPVPSEGVPSTPKDVNEDGNDSPPESLSVIVVNEAWIKHSPPLIAHRASYFSNDKTKRAIKTALKVYDAHVISQAIDLYATCLGSDEYRWTYSWTLIDFLKRGLDRFVPEARPLERERVRSTRDAQRSLDHIAEI